MRDPALSSLIFQESERQRAGITLVASENYAYPEIATIVGSSLADKYAEGYPDKRYYAGCTYVDQIETLAITRCMNLFSGEHANVQPHSGSAANMGVMLAMLKPGDTIMGMGLASGGHLTHGHHVSFSGRFFKSISYNVDKETERINYDHLNELAQLHKPQLIIAGASSYSYPINFEKYAEIARSINAYLLADCAHLAGLIAAGIHPSPFPHADFMTGTTHKTLRGPRGGFILCKTEHATQVDKSVFPLIQGGPFMNIIAGKAFAFEQATTPTFKQYQQQAIENAQYMAQSLASLGYRIVGGGTATHLFVIDLQNKEISGLEAEKTLESSGIYVSRSSIPFDTKSPIIASGIRIGTLALTTRDFKRNQIDLLVGYIDEALKHREHTPFLIELANKVQQLCFQAPLPDTRS